MALISQVLRKGEWTTCPQPHCSHDRTRSVYDRYCEQRDSTEIPSRKDALSLAQLHSDNLLTAILQTQQLIHSIINVANILWNIGLSLVQSHHKPAWNPLDLLADLSMYSQYNQPSPLRWQEVLLRASLACVPINKQTNKQQLVFKPVTSVLPLNHCFN